MPWERCTLPRPAQPSQHASVGPACPLRTAVTLRERLCDWLIGAALAVAVYVLSVILWPDLSHGAERIPAQAHQYRRLIVAAAHRELGGLNAPVAVLFAQAEQESGFNPEARSGVGAQGLAQFMPQTRDWMARIRPDLGPADAWNPAWALRAMAAYDRWLLDRVQGSTPCDEWAKALSGYNGGLGWVYRDEDMAERHGLDPQDWWSGVALVNAGRSRWAWDENRKYSERILMVKAPRYAAAGWGRGVCPGGGR